MEFDLDLCQENKYEKVSAAKYVERMLRKQIITGEIALGKRLVEREVAKKFGVSSTPVRHAIMALCDEGLIDIYPYKGNYVVSITPDMIKNVLESRYLIEYQAAKDSYFNMVKNDKNCLYNIIKEAENKFKNSIDYYGITQYDLLFHSTIVSNSNNKVLLDMLRVVYSRIMLIHCYTKKFMEFKIENFIENHNGIAEAVREEKGIEIFLSEVKKDLDRSLTIMEKMCILLKNRTNKIQDDQ